MLPYQGKPGQARVFWLRQRLSPPQPRTSNKCCRAGREHNGSCKHGLLPPSLSCSQASQASWPSSLGSAGKCPSWNGRSERFLKCSEEPRLLGERERRAPQPGDVGWDRLCRLLLLRWLHCWKWEPVFSRAVLKANSLWAGPYQRMKWGRGGF